jgi:multidrug efflux pump subunit AcrB
VKTTKSPGAYVITRVDGKRIIKVSGQIDSAKTSPVVAVAEMRPIVNKIISEEYPNLTFKFGGENEDTEESMQRLAKSGIMAVFCIFFILIAMFSSIGQPIVVMLAIPLGLIGVVYTFFFMNLSLSFMALLGIVALIGVVVNDSIVLVNFINLRREASDNEHLGITVYEATMLRVRPVLLTTFTTVAGLLPLAHSPSGDPFLKPMAISFAYGLLFSTFVTLIFIPCMYVVYIRISEFGSRLYVKIFKKDIECKSASELS